REQLNEAQRSAFDKLTGTGCDPMRLAACVVSLRCAVEASVEHQKDPKRMRSETVRSLTARMKRAAKDVERLYHSYFGSQLLERVAACEIGEDRSRIRAEFWNIPQRLRSLACEVSNVHRGTQRGRGKEYDDTLADLCVYVEWATGGQPHNLQV